MFGIKKLFRPSPAPAPRLKPGMPGYRPGFILFVDDEPELRTIAKMILENEGYRVQEASSGREALELFKAQSAAVGLVITDVIMPNMDGLTLSAELHKLDPELPIILLSGQVMEEDLWAPGNAGLRYLKKPYKMQELQGAVLDMLGPPEKAPSAG
jgi:CheY-like chemotaxis protein